MCFCEKEEMHVETLKMVILIGGQHGIQYAANEFYWDTVCEPYDACMHHTNWNKWINWL